MWISFRELRGGNHVQEIHESVAVPRIANENAQIESISPVQVALEAELANHVCRVQGLLQTTIVYQCSRCLDPFEQPLTTQFDESFTELPESTDEDVHVVQGDIIELDPWIEESVTLAIEYRPLCSVDCKGLCPVCGNNQNVAVCQCNKHPVDPRLAALEGLLSDDHSE